MFLGAFLSQIRCPPKIKRASGTPQAKGNRQGAPTPPAVLLENFAGISLSRWGAPWETHRGSFHLKGNPRPLPLQAIAFSASYARTIRSIIKHKWSSGIGEAGSSEGGRAFWWESWRL